MAGCLFHRPVQLDHERNTESTVLTTNPTKVQADFQVYGMTLLCSLLKLPQESRRDQLRALFFPCSRKPALKACVGTNLGLRPLQHRGRRSKVIEFILIRVCKPE